MLADLADLDQVRTLAEDVRQVTGRLDVLVCNAGIGRQAAGRERAVSADGYELRFAVNYLAGFLLTLELLPLLRRSAPARIVNVASLGQHAIDFDDIMITRGYSGSRAYGQSKLAQIMSGFALAGRLPAAEITVNSLHPATYMPTKMVLAGDRPPGRHPRDRDRRHPPPGQRSRPGRGHRPVLRPAREATASPQAYDAAARAALWQRSLELTGAPEPG